FKQIYAEYAQAKDVTKQRMYLETMEEVLKGMPKLLIEGGKGGALPVLPITLPTAKPTPAVTTIAPVATGAEAPATAAQR
ncbi:MAG: hypothetical protein K2X09_00740, partial [Rickettsiales bacterium]|nr:hypothetical protein [Rickettsiales bacterium]